MIYLDYAAATPIDKRVKEAMEPYCSDLFFNPSASYFLAKKVHADLESARHNLAQIIGARPAEIILTAGATESINIAVNSFAGDIITINVEHPAVLASVKARGGKVLAVEPNGLIDTGKLGALITDQTELISIGYVNSETGIIQDIKAVSNLVKSIRSDRVSRNISLPLLLHVDASQGAGLVDLNVARLGVDLMTLNASKCYGPKQVGLLYARAGVKLKPLISGGGQEMGIRSGTENVAGAVGFAKALTLADNTRKSELKRLSSLRNLAKKILVNDLGDKLVFNENTKHNAPNILNISYPSVDGERVLFALDEVGVMVATGSACAANKGLRSHVLLALGLSNELVDGSIRLSFGRFTKEDDIKKASHLIAESILAQLDFGVDDA